jgi:uncharacterized protein (TIGR03067 family)
LSRFRARESKPWITSAASLVSRGRDGLGEAVAELVLGLAKEEHPIPFSPHASIPNAHEVFDLRVRRDRYKLCTSVARDPIPLPGPAAPGPIPNPEAAMRLVLVATLLSASALIADDKKDDARKAFQGTWTIVHTKKGDAKDKEPVTAPTVVFEGNKYRIKAGDKVVEEGTFTVDGSKSPMHIEVAATAGMDRGKKWHGIYEIEGDTLRGGRADR